ICPEIKKAFQFVATRTERDLVARYDAESGGRFGPHRDDVGVFVAHRRFAVSINLNDDFDGGEISFPEYSPRGFKPLPGAAVVFSASILHQVSPVTRGRRYVFLTFLFDEAAESLRQANLRAVKTPQAAHRASAPA
ncbi:MAG: 2OG-Fe(II) oxygenase, partial [Hyphomicrobiales bacterium]|nr:2OG-Fe(II) oxygenase [Hyphomicrobiales bacterium]